MNIPMGMPVGIFITNGLSNILKTLIWQIFFWELSKRNPILDEPVKVNHVRRMKVSIANEVLEVDSFVV